MGNFVYHNMAWLHLVWAGYVLLPPPPSTGLCTLACAFWPTWDWRSGMQVWHMGYYMCNSVAWLHLTWAGVWCCPCSPAPQNGLCTYVRLLAYVGLMCRENSHGFQLYFQNLISTLYYGHCCSVVCKSLVQSSPPIWILRGIIDFDPGDCCIIRDYKMKVEMPSIYNVTEWTVQTRSCPLTTYKEVTPAVQHEWLFCMFGNCAALRSILSRHTGHVLVPHQARDASPP